MQFNDFSVESNCAVLLGHTCEHCVKPVGSERLLWFVIRRETGCEMSQFLLKQARHLLAAHVPVCVHVLELAMQLSAPPKWALPIVVVPAIQEVAIVRSQIMSSANSNGT